MQKPLIIAIDGPAASGKGTLARKLSEVLGIDYLPTGNLYRAVAKRMLALNLHIDNYHELIANIASTPIARAELESEDLGSDQIAMKAAKIAAIPEVRSALVAYQRQFANNAKGAILEGRDIGTVICPDAEIKFFITANPEIRATRRYQELSNKGKEISYQAVLQDLYARDKLDTTRANSPLKPAETAIIVDTSDMSIEEVLKYMLSFIVQADTDKARYP